MRAMIFAEAAERVSEVHMHSRAVNLHALLSCTSAGFDSGFDSTAVLSLQIDGREIYVR